MQTYREYAPTGFDPAGLNLPDRQDWFIAPVGIDRDSETLSLSNWEVFTTDLEKEVGPEGDDWEIHRFGHWACGWFEILLVKPGSNAYKIADDTETALLNYPVLDEQHFSSAEYDNYIESWDSWGASDFRRALCGSLTSPIAEYALDDIPASVLFELYEQNTNEPYYSDSGGGCNLNTQSAADNVTRLDLAAILRGSRVSA